MEIVEVDGEASRPLIAGLSAAVYPPHVLSTIVWRDVISARSERRILLRDAGCVVSTAGILWREALHNGEPVVIAGLAGVMTDPKRQRSGLGRLAVEHAMASMGGNERAAFGLLFCEPTNVEFYLRLGWLPFNGDVTVTQPAGRIAYKIMESMVTPLCEQAPNGGVLDLCGLPW